MREQTYISTEVIQPPISVHGVNGSSTPLTLDIPSQQSTRKSSLEVAPTTTFFSLVTMNFDLRR